jgi:hypothetical protein
MLEPCAMKVVSTVLSHCKVVFLSDFSLPKDTNLKELEFPQNKLTKFFRKNM